MPMDQSASVYLCFCVCLFSSKLFVSPAPTKLSFSENPDLQKTGVNPMSTPVFSPLLNLYLFLYYKVAPSAVFLEHLSARERRKEGSYSRTFKTENLLDDTGFGTRHKSESSANEADILDNNGGENISVYKEDKIFPNDIEKAISSKIKSQNVFPQKMDKENAGKLTRIFMSHPAHGEKLNDTIGGSAELDKESDNGNLNTETIQTVDKRQEVYCDLSKVTLNMLVEYFRYKTLCGVRTAKIRFGIGK